MTYETVEFPSEGTILRGHLYRAQNAALSPAVVMAHGTSATITMVTNDYAEAFHSAGLTVLLYDHINFGRSGGENRQVIDPWLQGRGFRDAVQYLQKQPFINPNKIALWGDSYTAMQVLVVGAMIDGLAGIVSQIPACGIDVQQDTSSPDRQKKLRELFETADFDSFEKDESGFMPVVSFDQIGTPSFLKPIQAYRWFMDYGGRFGTNWQNRVNRRIARTEVPFSPIETASALKSPVLFMTGKEDEMVHCNPDAQRAVYNLIKAPKEFVEMDGGHFGLLYPGSTEFNNAVQIQTRFLKDVLDLH